MITGYIRQDVANNIALGNIIDAADLDNEFDAIAASMNASTGHTHDGTAGGGARISVIGPGGSIIASGLNLTPNANNVVSLGTSSTRWKDAYFAGQVFSTGGFVGSFSGDSTTAAKLTTPRTISIGGSITGVATAFDGSANITISVTGINAGGLTTGNVPSARVVGSYSNITGVGALNQGSIASGFGNITIGSSIFSGNGQGITNLNADALATGTIPNARITGAYSGITTLAGSGQASFASFLGTSAQAFIARGGGETTPSFTWENDLTTGIYRSSAGAISITTAGTRTLRISSTQIFADNDAVFMGNGSGLTSLNASSLLTGTVPVDRLPTSAAAETWVANHFKNMATGTIGSVALMRVTSGTGLVTQGMTLNGSQLAYSNASGTAVGGAPNGTWRALGRTNDGDTTADRVTLFIRVT